MIRCPRFRIFRYGRVQERRYGVIITVLRRYFVFPAFVSGASYTASRSSVLVRSAREREKNGWKKRKREKGHRWWQLLRHVETSVTHEEHRYTPKMPNNLVRPTDPRKA